MNEMFFPDAYRHSCGTWIVFGAHIEHSGDLSGGPAFSTLKETRTVTCRCGESLAIQATPRTATRAPESHAAAS